MSTGCDYVNAFGLTQYDGQCSFFGGSTALPQGLGWFIVAGLGGIFALITSFLVWLDSR
jgi:MFS superfamily sulfate permease-like transporter